MDDELWKNESATTKSYAESIPVFLKIFLKKIQSNDIEELEKLKADVEVHMQMVLDSITALNELADPDRVKKMFPLAVACYNSEKEFVSILLSHVESRISEKKT